MRVKKFNYKCFTPSPHFHLLTSTLHSVRPPFTPSYRSHRERFARSPLVTMEPEDAEKAEKAAIDKRIEEITQQLTKLDDKNPAQFRARQLLQKELKDLKKGKIKIKTASTKSVEDGSVVSKRGMKTCKDLDTDESIRIREEGARKKKRGCLEHINEQQRRLGELKEKMAMEEETRKRVQEVLKAIMEMRATMQQTINKIAEETRTELSIIAKKLEHHDQDLALRKEIHTRYRKEQQVISSDFLNKCLSVLTKLVWYGLFIVALIRDKCVRPTKRYFSAERIEGSAETTGSKEPINSKEAIKTTEEKLPEKKEETKKVV